MALATEHLPKLAGAGLGGVVVLCVVLAYLRDPRSVAMAEEGAAPVAVTQAAVDGDGVIARAEARDESTPSASAAAPPPAPTLDEALIAKATTVAELRELEKQAPNDPRIQKKLARAYALTPDGLIDALIAAKRLFAADPKALADKEMLQIVMRAATGTPAAQDVAFPMMTGGMGTAGPDLLYEMTTAPSVTGPTKQKAIALTKDPEIRKIASPALRIALELRDRGPCERKSLFTEAEKSGDRRALAFLTPLAATKGCGVFSLEDCYDCLGGRSELTKAINGINARMKANGT